MSRLMFMLLIYPAVAIAQGQLPSDIDLKAAYCLPIVRSASQITIDENLPESWRNSVREQKDMGVVNLRRLNLYLVPRLSQLDVMPLIGANKSAEEDMERIKAEIAACYKGTGTTRDAYLKCLEIETEAKKRLRSCNALSFLPF